MASSLSVTFDRRLVQTAKKRFGVPRDYLLHAVRCRRILSAPVDWMHRASVARKISAKSDHSDLIDKKKGYHLFGPNDFPGLIDAVNAASAVYEDKRNRFDPKSAKKPFLINLLEKSDLERYPELLALAKSKPLIEAVIGYLGTVPKLRSISAFLSPANKLTEQSQKYHVDRNDLRQIKCFINVHECALENGPFTFIRADRTREIRDKFNHYRKVRRLDDEAVLSLCEPDDVISLEGGPGYGALVDTSNCLHFGSRTRTGHRLVLVLQYMRYPDAVVHDPKDQQRVGRSLLVNEDILKVYEGNHMPS